jgi:hypothetical protein
MNLQQWLRSQWDRVGALTFVGVGLLVLLVGWVGISDEALPSAQIPYILSGGILGLMLVGIGATSWLSADLRDEWRKLDDLEELLEQIVDRPAAGATTPATEASPLAPPTPIQARRSSV